MEPNKQISNLQALQEEARTLHQMTDQDASNCLESMNRKMELIFGVGSKYIERFSKLKYPPIAFLGLYLSEKTAAPIGEVRKNMVEKYSTEVVELLGVFINEIQELA